MVYLRELRKLLFGNTVRVRSPSSRPSRRLPPHSLSAFVGMRFVIQLLWAVSAAVGRIEADQDVQSHGRVCISLVEPGQPVKESPFRTTSKTGPGEKINIYLDASTKCVVMVVALSKEGKLANGWRPQLSEVPEDFEEIELPKAPVTWELMAPAAPTDFYVLFMPAGSKEAEELKRLISAMQTVKTADQLLEMQTNKLRELIGRIASAKEKSNQTLFKDPEIGGVFRGAEFPWRQFAQSVAFSDDRPGVLILAGEGRDLTAPTAQ
jgi:hypothetical protein